MNDTIDYTGPLWRWNGASGGAWHFVTISGDAADLLSVAALMRKHEGLGRGFGSLRVSARVGESLWQTSVFPQKETSGAQNWLLPVKAAVRKAEGLAEGEPVALTLQF